MKIIYKILLTLFIVCSVSYSKSLEKVTLQLDWLHQFQFAGYYMAKEKGFFEQNGLDVNIKEFNYGINQVDETLNGNVEYAIGKSSLIIDKLEGKNVLALAAIFQESPMVLISRKDSNIISPKDLASKKVMLTPDARSAVAINSMIVSQGLDLKDINFIPHSFNLDDLINKKTDSMGSYLSNEPFLLEQQNIPYNILNPKDYGFDFYGGILFTSENEFKNNPNRVHNFYTAIIKGWKYAFENIDETTELIFNKYNTQKKSKEALAYEGRILKKLAHYGQTDLGKIEIKKIKEIMKIYLLLGLTPLNNRDIEEFIFNQNELLITKEEKEYLRNNIIKHNTVMKRPLSFKENNQLKGIEIDYWKLIQKTTNMKSILSQDVYKNNIESLENRRIDIKPVSTHRDDNHNFFNYSKVVTEYKVAIATLNDKKYIPKTSFLDNKRVAICKECVIYKSIIKDYPNIKFIKVNDAAHGLELLSEGKVFASIGVLPVLINEISGNGFSNIKISGTTEYTFKMRYMVHKDNELLLSVVNKAIDKISKEQKHKIDTQYITVKYASTQDYSWVYKVALPLLIIIVIIVISNFRLKREVKRRVLAENNLHMIANTDELTQVLNRRKIDELYENNFSLAKRYLRPMSIIFFDVDNFKKINDDFGHKKGDEVLVELSKLIKANIRTTDNFGRWGGDEFIIILPETAEEDAYTTAQNLKGIVEIHNFPVSSQITSSFGVTGLKHEDSTEDMLNRVDHAMFDAKQKGKNFVKLA